MRHRIVYQDNLEEKPIECFFGRGERIGALSNIPMIIKGTINMARNLATRQDTFKAHLCNHD